MKIREKIAIAMAYNGERQDWDKEMSEFGASWWLKKADQAISALQKEMAERKVRRS